MRHFDYQGPILQMRQIDAPAPVPAVDARDFLVLDDLVGGTIELTLADAAGAGEARPGWH